MKRKIIALLTAALLLLGIFPAAAAEPLTDGFINPPADITIHKSDITPEKAAEEAAFCAKVINASADSSGEIRHYSYNDAVNLSEAVPFYDIYGNVLCYHFTYTTEGEVPLCGYVVISAHSDMPVLCEYGYGESPYKPQDGERILYINAWEYYTQRADGKYTDRFGIIRDARYVESDFIYFYEYRAWMYANDYDYILEIKELNAGLGGAAEQAAKEPGLIEKIKAFFRYIIGFFEKYMQYALFDLYYNSDSSEERMNEIQLNVLGFAAQNDCYLAESRFIDKKNLVPQPQDYYAGDYDVGSGICGAVSWMMLLGYYRDGRGYTNIPDDKTMFSDLIKIFDEITEKISPISSLADDICELISEKTELSVSSFDNSYEVIYALDAGIAQYLYNLGYKELAYNCIRNINFSIPVLTPAANAVLLRDVRSEIAEWLYKQTDGKLNVFSCVKQSASAIADRSLERGEPIVIGNWVSFSDQSYTNHYFLGTGYFKLRFDCKDGDNAVFTGEKTILEIFDTWGDDHSAFVDWDVLKSTSLYDVNSLASLG